VRSLLLPCRPVRVACSVGCTPVRAAARRTQVSSPRPFFPTARGRCQFCLFPGFVRSRVLSTSKDTDSPLTACRANLIGFPAGRKVRSETEGRTLGVLQPPKEGCRQCYQFQLHDFFIYLISPAGNLPQVDCGDLWPIARDGQIREIEGVSYLFHLGLVLISQILFGLLYVFPFELPSISKTMKCGYLPEKPE